MEEETRFQGQQPFAETNGESGTQDEGQLVGASSHGEFRRARRLRIRVRAVAPIQRPETG